MWDKEHKAQPIALPNIIKIKNKKKTIHFMMDSLNN